MKGHLLTVFSRHRDESLTNIGITPWDLRFRDLSPKPYRVLRFYRSGIAQTLNPKPLNPLGFNGSRKPKVWACIPSAPFRVKTFEPCRALSGFRVLNLNGSGLRFNYALWV